jgi:hypothetical protein
LPGSCSPASCWSGSASATVALMSAVPTARARGRPRTSSSGPRALDLELRAVCTTVPPDRRCGRARRRAGASPTAAPWSSSRGDRGRARTVAPVRAQRPIPPQKVS